MNGYYKRVKRGSAEDYKITVGKVYFITNFKFDADDGVTFTTSPSYRDLWEKVDAPDSMPKVLRQVRWLLETDSEFTGGMIYDVYNNSSTYDYVFTDEGIEFTGKFRGSNWEQILPEPDYSSLEYQTMVEQAFRDGAIIEYSSDNTDWKLIRNPSFHWGNSINSLYRIKGDSLTKSKSTLTTQEYNNLSNQERIDWMDKRNPCSEIQLTNLTNKENNMNPSDIIKTQTVVFGNVISESTSDDDLFGFINKVSKEITRLEDGNTDSKKMQAKIVDMKAQLAELVKFVDER